MCILPDFIYCAYIVTINNNNNNINNNNAIIIIKSMEHESDGDTNCQWRARYSHQRIGTGTGGLGNKRTSGDHQNYSVVEIGQNTKTSPRVLRRLAVTQVPVENRQLMLL